jgi:ferredoxin
MKSTLINQDNTRTAFVRLDVYACTACRECIDVCPNKVIDQSFLFIANTLISEEVRMYDAAKCIGCLKCVQACKFDAISTYKD